jgi:O-antigen ligase
MGAMTPAAAVSWSLAAAAFAAPLSIAATNVALGALTASVLWAWRGEAALRASFAAALRSPVLRLLGACAAWALVSALAGVDPSKGLKAWPKELHKMWAFAVLGAALGAAERGHALRALGTGLGAAALVGIGQTLALSGGEAGFVRARGFIHAVSYGEMMGLGLLGVACWLAVSAPKGRERGAVVLSAAALTAALALNQTRAVLIALGAAVPAAALEAPRLRRLLLGAFLALAAIATVWELMPTGGRSLLGLVAGSSSPAHRARLVLWKEAVGMAADRPVTGVGPGGFREAFERRAPAHGLDAERVWGSAHNLYLHQLAERGVPGLLLLLALFGAFYSGARAAWRERRDAPALWALTATVAFAVMNLTETAWQTEQVATFFLLCWLWGAGPRP